MQDARLDKLADVVVSHCAKVKRGDLVAIRADPGSMPAVLAIHRAVLCAGGHPTFHPRSELLEEQLLRLGSDEQIGHTNVFDLHLFSNCDVLIVLRQPINTRYLSGINPAKIAMAQRARGPIGLAGLAAGRQRYVQTEVPGQAAAQEADMSLEDYSDFVFKAGFLHLPDPVAEWRKVHERQERAISYLQSKNILRFTAPPVEHLSQKETDLTIDVSGRSWLNQGGGENFPDGELDGGPRAVDGIVNFTHPSIFKGKQVEGIRLKFKAGKVVEASATKNEQHLIAILDQDPGASVAGEIGIGTNYNLNRFINNTFFDEKIGGTFHLALGAGYPQTGNTNQSSIHWDLVADLRCGGMISADGEPIQQDGKFLFNAWPA